MMLGSGNGVNRAHLAPVWGADISKKKGLSLCHGDV